MNPHELFCPNMDCPARGQKGKGNLQVHSQKDQRYLCNVCGQTFATTKGTIFYRLRHAPERVIQVLVLLAYGCPVQAIVKAFGLDERTVSDWQERAGKHCQSIHEHMVEKSQQDLQQVQADDTCTCMQVQVNQGQDSVWDVLDGPGNGSPYSSMVRRCSQSQARLGFDPILG